MASRVDFRIVREPVLRDVALGRTARMQRWHGAWSGEKLSGPGTMSDGDCMDATGAPCPNLATARAKQVLAERQVVELTHRFVNMLQILGNRIERQRRMHGEPAGRNDLEKLVASIHASGRLHRYLLPPRKHVHVDLGALLVNVAAAIEGAIGLRCHVESELVTVSNEVAMHLAAAVYELAWNAHKHAYGGIEGGVIRIVCRRESGGREGEKREGGGRLWLSVADRGCGLPADFDPLACEGLGLMVVCATVRQFSGELRIESDRGAAFTLLLSIPRA